MKTGLALFVYKRPEHTGKVIESIRKNDFSKIYIFQDGLRDEKDREKWEEVSKLIKGITFAETEIHISKHNKGLANSIVEGMNYVFQKHDTAIALEDDVVLSDGYKAFMEACFERYRDDKKIVSVSGGGHGVIIPDDYEYDMYFSYRMSSVAFGTWRDRWEGYDRNPAILQKIKDDDEKRRWLRLAGNDIEKMVAASMAGKIDTWATYWVLHQVNKKGYHIIPTDVYAEDIGRDGTGTNTKTETHLYDVDSCLSVKKKKEWRFPPNYYIDERLTKDTLALMDCLPDKERNKFYKNILKKWFWVHLRHKKFRQYFKKYGISEIYIFGTEKISGWFYKEVEEEVVVRAFLAVEKRREVLLGTEVVEPDGKSNLWRQDVPIIIASSCSQKLIKHIFKKNEIRNQVIQLEEILNALLAE